MKKTALIFLVCFVSLIFFLNPHPNQSSAQTENATQLEYWFSLNREAGIEYLYYGMPGEIYQSNLIRIFNVKTGIPGKRPTPLPEFLGRKYWNIVNKRITTENSEAGAYFLVLDIPNSMNPPFGPVPYPECDGQCNWEVPGEFGLHGINGDTSKLAAENEGSSGCIRHSDEDIRFIYSILDTSHLPVRLYINGK